MSQGNGFQKNITYNDPIPFRCFYGIEKAKIDLMLHDIIWNLGRIINTTREKIIWST